MTTIKKMIIKKHGNMSSFAKSVGWTNQRAYYIAKKDPKKMNLATISRVAKLLKCKIDDLI